MKKMGAQGFIWIKHFCQDAVDLLNLLGIEKTINTTTLSYWKIQFWRTGKFPHPNPYIANGLQPKPVLFEYFPTSTDESSAYISEHLDHFSIEMLCSEIITITILELMKNAEEKETKQDTVEYQLLKQCEVKPHCQKVSPLFGIQKRLHAEDMLCRGS